MKTNIPISVEHREQSELNMIDVYKRVTFCAHNETKKRNLFSKWTNLHQDPVIWESRSKIRFLSSIVSLSNNNCNCSSSSGVSPVPHSEDEFFEAALSSIVSRKEEDW